MAIQRSVLAWGPGHFQRFPWRRKLPLWQALVAEILLQRTRAKQVAPVFEAFQGRFRTTASFGAASTSELAALFDPLGLQWRVRLLKEFAKVVSQRGGRLPRKPETLVALPGVGPYAASALLTFHGRIRRPLIDANTVRIACRVMGVKYDGETRRRTWLQEAIDQLTPIERWCEFSYALIDLGIQICRPRRPICPRCPIRSVCRTGRGSIDRDVLIGE